MAAKEQSDVCDDSLHPPLSKIGVKLTNLLDDISSSLSAPFPARHGCVSSLSNFVIHKWLWLILRCTVCAIVFLLLLELVASYPMVISALLSTSLKLCIQCQRLVVIAQLVLILYSNSIFSLHLTPTPSHHFVFPSHILLLFIPLLDAIGSARLNARVPTTPSSRLHPLSVT